MKEQLRFHFVFLFLLWALIHGILFWRLGIREMYDATYYIFEADNLVKHGVLKDAAYAFYFVPISVLAFCRWLFPGEVIPFIVVQTIVSGLATIALYKSSTKIFKSTLAGFCSSSLILLWVDNIHWNIAVMTESLMCSLICFVIFVLTRFKNRLHDYLYMLVLAAMILFTRPTGIVVIISAIVFVLKYYENVLVKRMVLKISIIVSLLVIAYFAADFMFARWNFTEQFHDGNVVTYMNTLEGDSLYKESLRIDASNLNMSPTDNFSVVTLLTLIYHNPIFFIKSGGLKVWYLLTATRPYYSGFHNLYSILWVSLIYVLYFFGWKNTDYDAIKIFTLVMVVINCALIAISTVDWDNRFYIPMEPGLVLLAGGGLSYLLTKMKLIPTEEFS